jgi:hypothetical protein
MGHPGISLASSAMSSAPPPGSFGSSGAKAVRAPSASAAAPAAAAAYAAATASTAAAAYAAVASAAATLATSAAVPVRAVKISARLKNLQPACRVISGVKVQKRTDESAREHVRFGDLSLTVLRVRPQ